MSIYVGAQVAIILLAFGPCVVIVYGWDRLCTLGRAPRTKEICPIFMSDVGLLDIYEYSAGLRVVNGHPGFGASQLGIIA